MKGDAFLASRNIAAADDFAILCRYLAPFRRIQRGGSARLLFKTRPESPDFRAFEKRPTPGTARNFVLFSISNSAARRGEPVLARGFSEFKYMTFDVVGTLIDFEGGITTCLAEIAAEAGVSIDGEEALALYRQARYMPDANLFPDDLVRVYT
ncbi:MAG: hypothetical protein E5X11_17160, partial [Mesorhizobium sp.]